ncbi:uncharacterized protein LOC122264336 isoform X1 [Penaeus japonicus]|uniref:uncharacterized protein LOC122264336 isoform X1 n=1 Tax=Penaeus japonicus TaxID=27405 RepID=UPI001C711D7F|nr:uncharacterized protein LOC122264336 isoform X1 [Penaeus japonicus]
MLLASAREGPGFLQLTIACLLGLVLFPPVSSTLNEVKVNRLVLRETSRRNRAFTIFAYTPDNCTSCCDAISKLAELRRCNGKRLSDMSIPLCKEIQTCPHISSKSRACFAVAVDDIIATIKFPASEDVVLISKEVVTTSNWTQRDNISTLVVMWNEHVKYELRLHPLSQRNYETLDGKVHENSSILFQVDWSNLSHTSYSVFIILRNFCDTVVEKIEAPALRYIRPEAQVNKDSSDYPKVMIVIIGSATTMVMAGLFFLVFKAKGHWLKAEAANSTPKPREDPRDTPSATAATKSVLLVYAKDVLPRARKLLNELREKAACEILDLHDVHDFDKLHDSTAWLISNLRSPAVLKILVVSEEGERLQDLYRSSRQNQTDEEEENQAPQASPVDAEGGSGLIGGPRATLTHGVSDDSLSLPASRTKETGLERTVAVAGIEGVANGPPGAFPIHTDLPTETSPRLGKRGCIRPGNSTGNQSESSGGRGLSDEGEETVLGFLYEYMIQVQESSCLFQNSSLVYKVQFADGPLARVTDSRFYLLPRQTHFLVQAINAFAAGK